MARGVFPQKRNIEQPTGMQTKVEAAKRDCAQSGKGGGLTRDLIIFTSRAKAFHNVS